MWRQMTQTVEPARSADGTMPLLRWTDHELVIAAAPYREVAYVELYSRHTAAVGTVARKILGTTNGCDDIVAEVFMALWLWPEKFEPARGSLSVYLRVKARGRSIDLVRSEVQRRKREDSHRYGPYPPAPPAAVDAVVLADELSDELHSAVESLPMAERTVVTLAYFGGMSYQAVAIHLRLPEGTVKSRIRNGLRHLRNDWSGSEDTRPPPSAPWAN